MLSSFVADGGEVERFVVVSACGEYRAIAQLRCRGLTGTDIHNFICMQTGDNNADRDYLPRLRLGDKWNTMNQCQ